MVCSIEETASCSPKFIFYLFSISQEPSFHLGTWLPKMKAAFLTLPCSWVWPSNSFLDNGILVTIMHDYFWTSMCKRNRPLLPHIPLPTWISLDKIILERDSKVISLSLGTIKIKDPEKELYLRLDHSDSLEPSPAYPISIETTYS